MLPTGIYAPRVPSGLPDVKDSAGQPLDNNCPNRCLAAGQMVTCQLHDAAAGLGRVCLGCTGANGSSLGLKCTTTSPTSLHGPWAGDMSPQECRALQGRGEHSPSAPPR